MRAATCLQILHAISLLPPTSFFLLRRNLLQNNVTQRSHSSSRTFPLFILFSHHLFGVLKHMQSAYFALDVWTRVAECTLSVLRWRDVWLYGLLRVHNVCPSLYYKYPPEFWWIFLLSTKFQLLEKWFEIFVEKVTNYIDYKNIIPLTHFDCHYYIM